MFVQPVTASSWPWVALIESYFPALNGRFTVASASLIHPRVLLTAGHVIYDGTRGGYPDRVRAVFRGTTLGPVTAAGPRNMPTTWQWIERDAATLNPASAFDVAAILLPAPIPTAEAVGQAYARRRGRT
jgi:V8-like Glu-specific endopeptidase